MLHKHLDKSGNEMAKHVEEKSHLQACYRGCGWRTERLLLPFLGSRPSPKQVAHRYIGKTSENLESDELLDKPQPCLLTTALPWRQQDHVLHIVSHLKIFGSREFEGNRNHQSRGNTRKCKEDPTGQMVGKLATKDKRDRVQRVSPL